MSLQFSEFQSQVLSYLPFEIRDNYDDAGFWDEMVFQVVEQITNEAD